MKNVKGKIVLIFSSYAVCEADELSDIDVLVINGKYKEGFVFSLSEFKKLLKNKNQTVLSILKKHAIIKGFEEFVEVVLEWKKNLRGV